MRRKIINNAFIGAGVLVSLSIITALCVNLVMAIVDQYGEFKYMTSSGETGTASFCTVSYGQSICRTDDGITIMVESYTKMNKIEEIGGEE